MHRFNDTYLAAARRCVCGAKEGAEAMEARLTALSYTRCFTLSLSHTLAHTPSLSGPGHGAHRQAVVAHPPPRGAPCGEGLFARRVCAAG